MPTYWPYAVTIFACETTNQAEVALLGDLHSLQEPLWGNFRLFMIYNNVVFKSKTRKWLVSSVAASETHDVLCPDKLCQVIMFPSLPNYPPGLTENVRRTYLEAFL